MMEFDLARVEAGLHTLFPSLDIPSPLTVLGSGFNSLVVEAGGTIIFRIGKNPAAQAGYERENNYLLRIAPQLPFPIPHPKWYLGTSPYFPFGMIGYDKIPGRPLQPHMLTHTNLALLGGDIAKFLLALHQIPSDFVPGRNIDAPLSEWESRYREVLPVLKGELSSSEFTTMERWWRAFLADGTMRQYRPVLQHGDLWYENMLVDAGLKTLTGIVDWERISIGDPAQDFATLFHSGEEFVRVVIEAYRSLGGELDGNFEHRLQRLWEAREFDGLQHAIKFDDPGEADDALRKLRRGPILKRTL